jgi:putative membrane protein
MRRLLAAAAGCVALACPATIPTASAQSAEAAPQAEQIDAADYVRRTADSNVFEIAAARAALDKTSSEDVRSFARMIADDHGKAADQLAEAAKGQNLSTALPDTVDAKHDQVLQQLANATEQDFDLLYMRTQLEAHTEALKLQQDYSSFGGNPALKAVATQLVPVIKRHHDEAQAILDRLSKG